MEAYVSFFKLPGQVRQLKQIFLYPIEQHISKREEILPRAQGYAIRSTFKAESRTSFGTGSAYRQIFPATGS
jgi:hypothetical protein